MKIIKSFNEHIMYTTEPEKILKCPNCGEEKKLEYIAPTDYKRDDKGDYHRILVYKCEECGKEFSYCNY